jgi:hypothetical protein
MYQKETEGSLAGLVFLHIFFAEAVNFFERDV